MKTNDYSKKCSETKKKHCLETKPQEISCKLTNNTNSTEKLDK